LRPYSTDDLRHLYHAAEGGGDAAVRLRAGVISRDELKTEILRRLWWGRFSYFILLTVSR